MIGIIGAMEAEIELLTADLGRHETEEAAGFVLHKGNLHGHEVEVAECGVGKVNAAMLATLLCLRNARAVIFSGVAGALHPGLAVGDLVISVDCVQHDVDVTALGYAPGQVPGETFAWRADDGLRRLARAACAELDGVRVREGRVLSGDRFVADPEAARGLHELFGAACVEMEGAAVAQVCARAGVPFLVIRSMSDTADGNAQPDFRAFTRLAAQQSRQVVHGLLQRCKVLPAGE